MVFISISGGWFRITAFSVWLMACVCFEGLPLGLQKACKLFQFSHSVQCDGESVKQSAKAIALGISLFWTLWAVPFIVNKYLVKRVTTNKKVINDLETILLPIFKVVATDNRFKKLFGGTKNGKREYTTADLYYTTKFIIKVVDSRYCRTQTDHDNLRQVSEALNKVRCDNGHICLDKWITNEDVESAVKNAKTFVQLIADRKKTIDINDSKLFEYMKDIVYRNLGFRVGIYNKATKSIDELNNQWISEMKKKL